MTGKAREEEDQASERAKEVRKRDRNRRWKDMNAENDSLTVNCGQCKVTENNSGTFCKLTFVQFYPCSYCKCGHQGFKARSPGP